MKTLIVFFLLSMACSTSAQLIPTMFSKKDSATYKRVYYDWQHNPCYDYKVQDTTEVDLNIYDSLGYVRRIKAYKIISGHCIIYRQRDMYISEGWRKELDLYYVDKRTLKQIDSYNIAR